MKGHTKVASDLLAGMQAEEARPRHERVEYTEQMKLKKENKLATERLQETDRKLKQAKKEMRQNAKVLEAMNRSRAYTLESLGKGHKKGGAVAHAKNRRQVMEQVLKVGELSLEQQFHWFLQNRLG